MSESNKTYRIRTTVGADHYVNVMLDQDYDNFEILSLKIDRENAYKMHTSNYGCIAGRVLANGAYGIPNAKISVFIPTQESDEIDPVLAALYPYETTLDKNAETIRYNTLPDEKNGTCHQAVGTFPNKRLVLDDDNVLEIYDKYYKYSTVSNEAGDYMIFGVPTGEQTVHVDIDLSDIGELSQTPRDMIFKGYNINQFESPSMFKKSTELETLTQIISQDSSVFVNPFWGDDTASNISITRNDIDVKYKFEPTCVFIGSLVTDGGNNGISQNCIPTKEMGNMDQLKGSAGTIEMIRKTPTNEVESLVIHGTKLIDGNGTWCYQIPMNLDYMGTDEYGNTVPTNDPNKGIPTRTRVRFRVSLTDSSSEYVNRHVAKVLIPNNPSDPGDLDYAFGSYSKDDDEGTKSFRDLFTNNVYTVKSYIPRIQKSNAQRNEHFSGFKNISVTNGNNPLPYNNMRVNISFMFILQCAILKIVIRIIRIINKWRCALSSKTCIVMGDGVCPDLEGWYFAPGCKDSRMSKTLKELDGDEEEGSSPQNQMNDQNSVDAKNSGGESMCMTSNLDYLMQCVEINLAMEYQVIKFDFYNDWINGMIYIPHWFANIRKKRSFLFGLIKIPEKVQACMEDTFFKSRKFVQQCALSYGRDTSTNLYTKVATPLGCKSDKKQRCHKGKGRNNRLIMGKTGGLVHNELTLKQEHVYYFRPCEWLDTLNAYPTKCILFATDIVMLGSLDEYNKDGIPSAFNDLVGSSFKLPGNLVSTNLETDGPLYGMSNGSVCNGSSPTIQDGVKPTTDYNTYARNSDDGIEDYDGTNNGSEYKISEMSGIDWGFSGPGQGENELKDLYFPGGHFLGISCFNSETNIKSCVNLSRACEIGVNLSQFQAIATGLTEDGANKNVEYLKKIPNGFISKDEINDSNFRNIFATLNFNGLRTRVDSETNYRRYDFISSISLNFDGTLADKVKNSSYERKPLAERFDGINLSERFNHSSLEATSLDYYRFRLGLPNQDVRRFNLLVKSRYLQNSGSYVSIPMYRNSFYFYFGIKDGQTAYDRFLDEFYSVCPDETLPSPTIELIKTKNSDVCTKKDGNATFEIDGLGSAYILRLFSVTDNNGINSLTQMSGLSFVTENNTVYVAVNVTGGTDEIVVGTTELASQFKHFTIGYGSENGLELGDYQLSIIALSDNKEIIKNFTIDTDTPEELIDVIESIRTTDFNEEWGGSNRNVQNTSLKGFISMTIPSELNGYIKKIIISFYYGDAVCDFDLSTRSGVNNSSYVSWNHSSGSLDVFVPSGNTSYEIKFVIKCAKENENYELDALYFVGMPIAFDYCFGSEEASGYLVRYVLKNDIQFSDGGRIGKIFKSGSESINLPGNWYKDDVKWYKNPKLSGLTPERLWLLEKTLIYDKTMFDPEDSGGNSINLLLVGGNLPYTRVINGHGEKLSETSEKYRLLDYMEVDEENAEKKNVNDAYVCDYEDFRFPTHIDTAPKFSKPATFQDHIQKAKDLSIVNDSINVNKLENYNLYLTDNKKDDSVSERNDLEFI